MRQSKISPAVFSISSNTALNPHTFRNNIDALALSRCSECFIHELLSHGRSGAKCLKLSSSSSDNTCGVDGATASGAQSVSNCVVRENCDSV